MACHRTGGGGAVVAAADGAVVAAAGGAVVAWDGSSCRERRRTREALSEFVVNLIVIVLVVELVRSGISEPLRPTWSGSLVPSNICEKLKPKS